jgi:alpha-beta hydrolase superfamily lysophospholipase
VAAEQFSAGGLAVYALDHRGRGRSGGERFYIEKSADYVSDLATFIRLAKSREPGLPVFLLGHSAGGVISCLYAIESQSELAGLICESFAFQVPAPDIALVVLKGPSRIAPHTHVLALKNKDFSRDPKVVQAMNDDPLIAGRASRRRRSQSWSVPASDSRGNFRSSRCRSSSCTVHSTKRPSRLGASTFMMQPARRTRR